MSINNGYDLERFQRHIPHTLEKQLILGLCEDFLGRNPDEDASCRCKSSMTHFYGALLFVDISGKMS